MKVKVVKKHPTDWEIIDFPTFPAGTAVEHLAADCDEDFYHWHDCKIDGHKTFVPITFVQNGGLTRDYNPTELRATVGDILQVREIVNAWLIVTNKDGATGWIPTENVVSVKE